MARYLAAAFAVFLLTPSVAGATGASGASGSQADRQPAASGATSEAPQPAAPSAADSASLARIRAGLERPNVLTGEQLQTSLPTFRTEVVENVIELRDRWSLRDPDKTPPPFAYPIPSAAELLINAVILKPKAALSARKQRAIKKQIKSELQQIEQQQEQQQQQQQQPRDPSH